MLPTRRTILQRGVAVLAAPALRAATESLPGAPFRRGQGWQPLLNGRDLSGWHSEPGWHGSPDRLNEWCTAGAASLSDADPRVLSATPAPGGIILNGVRTHTSNLISERKFGDVELYLEFMVSKESNSGVYLHGLYEVQILDSYGKPGPLKYSDAGGIYEQVDKDNRGFGGTPPSVNASKRPGDWQSYHIWFRAPRFDPAGRKTGAATFEKVIYNGRLVHRNVACGSPTRSALALPEACELHDALEAGPRPAQQHGDQRGGDHRRPQLLEDAPKPRERPVGALRYRQRQHVERAARLDAQHRARRREGRRRLRIAGELLEASPRAAFAQVPEGDDGDEPRAQRSSLQHAHQPIVDAVQAEQRHQPLGDLALGPLARAIPHGDEIGQVAR